MGNLPTHVAVIMDGNGRWARERRLPRIEGHRAGAKTVRMVVEESRRLGVRHLTLFAFSSENWNRPSAEVSALMALFQRYLDSELETLLKNGVRLRAIGDHSRLSNSVQRALRSAEERTAHLDGMDLILAVSYGGRDEIVRAVRKISDAVGRGDLDPSDISEHSFRSFLDLPDVPDPDLLIRTSDENRISNFLLWQLAYSEICVVPEFWPALTKERYRQCIEEFSGRTRRFGMTDEQLLQNETGTEVS